METFPVDKYIFNLVDDPNNKLGYEEKESILKQAVPVARKAFRNEAVTETDIITHAFDVSTAVYIKDKMGNLIGFSSCVQENVLGKIIIHLKGTVLLPDYQGDGLYSLLIVLRILAEAEKQNGNSPLIGTRTQSPIVYYTMSEKLGLYPKLNEPTPNELINTATLYAQIISDKHSDFHPSRGVDFVQDSFIIRRAYGGVDASGKEFGYCLYGDNVPWLRNNESVNNYVKSHLNLNDGDAFLLLGNYDYKKTFGLLIDCVKKLAPSQPAIVERFRR